MPVLTYSPSYVVPFVVGVYRSHRPILIRCPFPTLPVDLLELIGAGAIYWPVVVVALRIYLLLRRF